MVPKAYEYSLKPSQDRMFLNEKDGSVQIFVG